MAAAELRLKFRTGGIEADLFPSVPTVAAWIDAALDRETPFKCTAGLHDAVRHRDPATGFDHHGFLNVLAATRTALDGGDVVAVLAEEDGAALVAGPARRWRHAGPDPALVHVVRLLRGARAAGGPGRASAWFRQSP